MIIITNWNEILTSNISDGLKADIKTFYKELVYGNMGEDHLTYDFTEIGKIAILEQSDDIDIWHDEIWFAYRMPIVEVQTPNNNLNKLAEEKVA